MAARKAAKSAKKGSSSSIKARLRAGKLTAADIRKLESMVTKVEQAAKQLRGAVVE